VFWINSLKKGRCHGLKRRKWGRISDICKASDVKKLEKKVKALDMRLKALEEPKVKKADKK
jgi:hypothetical protein